MKKKIRNKVGRKFSKYVVMNLSVSNRQLLADTFFIRALT